MNETTERKLLVAYSKLIRRQAEKISVTELCKKAELSRATFYIYYKDIDEYAEKLGEHIVLRLFEQAAKLMRCSDYEFPSAIKKENLIFDEYETKILENMLSGTNYLSFATLANVCYVRGKLSSPFSDYAWEKHQEEIDIFTRGYLIILIFGLIDYEETSFRRDMRNCRTYFKALCERFENQDL